MLRGLQYGIEIDWFAYGVTLYELFHGRRPWSTEQIHQYERIVQLNNSSTLAVPDMPDFHISSRATPELRDLLAQLLCTDINKRLNTVNSIKSHCYFDNIDWVEIENKSKHGVMIPNSASANYDITLDGIEQQSIAATLPDHIQAQQQRCFAQWNYDSTKQYRDRHNAYTKRMYKSINQSIDQLSLNLLPIDKQPALRLHVSHSRIDELSNDNGIQQQQLSPTRAHRLSIQTRNNTEHRLSNTLSPTQPPRILSGSPQQHARYNSNSLMSPPSVNQHSYSIRSPRASYGVTQLSRASYSNAISPLQSPVVHTQSISSRFDWQRRSTINSTNTSPLLQLRDRDSISQPIHNRRSTMDTAQVHPQQNISVSVQHTQFDRSIGSSIDPLDSSNMIIEFD